MDGWGCSGLVWHRSCRTEREVYRWDRDSGLGRLQRTGSGPAVRGLASAQQLFSLVKHLAGRQVRCDHLVCLGDQRRIPYRVSGQKPGMPRGALQGGPTGLVLRPGWLESRPEDLAGVADDGNDLGVRIATTERRHAPASVGNHLHLVS